MIKSIGVEKTQWAWIFWSNRKKNLEKVEKTENQRLFSDSIGNWGHRTDCCSENWRVKQILRIKAFQEQKTTYGARTGGNLRDDWGIAGGAVWTSLSVRNIGRAHSPRAFTLLWVSTSGALPGSQSKDCRKIPLCSCFREERWVEVMTILKHSQKTLFP